MQKTGTNIKVEAWKYLGLKPGKISRVEKPKIRIFTSISRSKVLKIVLDIEISLQKVLKTCTSQKDIKSGFEIHKSAPTCHQQRGRLLKK